jgi:TolB-like protein/Tfp pilus assembly protein PilF
MFTDVVGYASIAEKNEARALGLLGEHRRLLQSVFSKHEGHVVKTMGDGFLVEFASAVEAVNCAVEAQREMQRFNSPRVLERVLIRIGVHVGEVIHSEEDVLGDAVNVAARVESLAEPGGICITRQVVDQIERKVDYKIVKMGTRELKNIHRSVELYRLLVPAEMSRLGESSTFDRRRLAILPFANLSPDPEDRYFADGMTEEIISAVSKIGELSVISRTSVMRYKEGTVPIGQIGSELSVGSVVEGSVRKAGKKVRISAQLIDVESDRHLWAQSYDRDLTDVFAIQGDIAQQVAEALKVQLLSNQKRSIEKSMTNSPDAYTLYLKGRFYWNERSEDGVKKAVKYFEEAIKIDPRFALAHSGLADCYNVLADYTWMPPAQAHPLAKDHAVMALEIDDSLAEAHASLGLTLMSHFWDFDSAEREFRRAIELKPNYVPAYHWYHLLLFWRMRPEEAFMKEKRAYELDPYSRVVSMGIGNSLLSLGNVDQAIEQYKRVIELNPDFAVVHLWNAFAYAMVSKYEQAIEEGKKAIELDRRSIESKLTLAWVYAVSGQTEAAGKLLREVLTEADRVYVSPTWVAMVELAIGRKDEGFRSLEKAYDERDSQLLYFRRFPWLQAYRSDPRWLEIERRIGLSEKV